jgi:hypothetical protein
MIPGRTDIENRQPKRVAFFAPDAIPRTGSGKVQKFKLKPILRDALELEFTRD